MQKRKKMNIWASAGINLAFCLFTLLAISLILALIASFTKNPISFTELFGLISLLLSGAICGFITNKSDKERGFKIMLMSLGVIIFIIIVASVLLCEGKVSGMAFMNCLCYILSSLLFAYLAKRERKGKRRKRR